MLSDICQRENLFRWGGIHTGINRQMHKKEGCTNVDTSCMREGNTAGQWGKNRLSKMVLGYVTTHMEKKTELDPSVIPYT